MYPRTFHENFMRYEASDQVFVAMPFSPPFRAAFERVIEPAIRRVSVRGRPLVARIINRATSGAPDIHEQIFDAVLHSRIVLADMTVQASCPDERGGVRWQANANVTYEVGLASAWRNPEDILLVHQRNPSHTYSFDVQNLRHVEYDLASPTAVEMLSDEIVRAVNQSSFVSKMAYQKILEGASPSAIQFMHQEVRRAFPVIAFQSPGMPIMDTRIHALTELLAVRALKNRNVIAQGPGKGTAIVYEWTELGLRMLLSLHAASEVRVREIRAQIGSVAAGDIPPAALRDMPEANVDAPSQVDMVKAAEVDPTTEAVSPSTGAG